MRDVTPYVPLGSHERNLRWFGASPSASAATNSGAMTTCLAALPSSGGRIFVPGGGVYSFSDDMIFAKPVNLVGEGSGLTSGARPTELRFAAGKGIVLTDLARKSVIAHLALTSEDNGVGTGVGIRCRASRSLVSDVFIEDFGSHGLFFDTAARTPSAATLSGATATLTSTSHGIVVGEQLVLAGFTASAWNGAKVVTSVTTNTISFAAGSIAGDASVIGTFYAGNANHARAEGVRSINNGGDGIRIEGSDCNVVTLDSCDGSGNAGYGIANYGDKTGIYSSHASTNTTGDYYDRGGSSAWINPYSEGTGKFVIDTGRSSWGFLLSVGVHAPPAIWSGNPPVLGVVAATNAGWVILDKNRWARWIEVISAAGTNVWRLNVDGVTTDQLTVRNVTTGVNVATFDGSSGAPRLRLHGGVTFDDAKNLTFNATTGSKIGTATTEKLAFYGKTPIVQPASANQATVAATAATNSSPYGYSQAQADGIVALLNEMRSALVNLGLMKGSA